MLHVMVTCVRKSYKINKNLYLFSLTGMLSFLTQVAAYVQSNYPNQIASLLSLVSYIETTYPSILTFPLQSIAFMMSSVANPDAAHRAGQEGGYRVTDTAFTAVEKTGELASSAVRTSTNMVDRVFEGVDGVMHRVNVNIRNSATGRTFVLLGGLLSVIPVATYAGFAAVSSIVTLSAWAMIQLGILGFGMLFLLPALGFSLFVAAMGASSVGATVLAWKLFQYTRDMVMRRMGGGMMPTGAKRGGMGGTGTSRSGAETGTGIGEGLSKAAQAAGQVAGQAADVGSTAAQVVKEAGKGVMEGAAKATKEHWNRSD
jgi:hypothetical protein